jgi:hypothetical protein
MASVQSRTRAGYGHLGTDKPLITSAGALETLREWSLLQPQRGGGEAWPFPANPYNVGLNRPLASTSRRSCGSRFHDRLPATAERVRVNRNHALLPSRVPFSLMLRVVTELAVASTAANSM